MLSPPELIKIRSKLLQATREFFFSRDYLEVETPVRIAAPAMENYIDAEESGNFYLRTSPELHMKRILGMGLNKIFQIGPCFRKGEKGNLHNPEFSMLEWYAVEVDYLDILEETKQFLLFTAQKLRGKSTIEIYNVPLDLIKGWKSFTISEIYKSIAGWDPLTNFDQDRFDMDMIEKIEPFLRKTGLCVLMDYPPAAAAFARCDYSKVPPVAERWEIYIGGVELANAFGELTDPVEQRKRFEEIAEQRKNRRQSIYPLDEAFLKALENGIPPCSGVALGLDRWLMLLTGEQSIDKVRVFLE